MTDADAAYFRDLAAQCRRLAKLSRDPEMIAELNEIADALIARADLWTWPTYAQLLEAHSD